MKSDENQNDGEVASAREQKNEDLDDVLCQFQNLDLGCNKKEVEIFDFLQENETPFLWHTQQERGLGIDLNIQRCSEKLEELKLEVEESDFSLRRYVVLLKLVLEYSILKDMKNSWVYMNDIENWLEKDSSMGNLFYEKVKLILGHVVTSTRAQLLALDGELEKSQKLAKQIIPLKLMGDQELAGLKMMKANFFLYSGYENGEKVAVQLARDALKLEPSNTEWKYLLAKFLRQQRKGLPFSSEIPYEELELLEKACSMDKNPKYMIYLAQVYKECGSQTLRSYRNEPGFYKSDLFRQVEEMSFKAKELYKEALKLGPDHPVSLRRIGYGLMNLPKKIADYDLALKCLLRSYELFPNQTTMHILGTYYLRFGKDNEKALEYFKKTAETGSVAGLSDMIRVKYILDPEYNPCEDIENGLKMEIKKKFRCELLAQLGGYFLFCKRDFLQSLEYFNKAIDEDKEFFQIMNFKSFFLRMYDPINLLKYLANEALLFLEKGSSSSSKTENSPSSNSSDNQSGPVEDLIFKISGIDPKLVEISPDPSLIDRLLKVSEEITEKEKGQDKSKGRSNYQGRGNRGRASGSYRRDDSHENRVNPRGGRRSKFGSGRVAY